MIVATANLTRLQQTVTMVDGGFDPLHHGHVAYFRAAAALGLPVLCNIAPDSWVARKHAPLLRQDERALVIDAIGDIAYTHLALGATAEVLRDLRPRYYVKGADWRGRLPVDELELCATHSIEIVFVEVRLGSSTSILERYLLGKRNGVRS